MTSRFNQSLAFTLQEEGGFTDNPADPGGATNKGITQRVYDAYRQRLGLYLRSVQLITDDEVNDIYDQEYWMPLSCDLLPAPVDLVVFDFAVNAGDTRSEDTLQKVLGVQVTGKVDPDTLQAVGGIDPNQLAQQLLDAREAFYTNLANERPALGEFLHGWLNRVQSLREAIKGE